MGVLTVLEASGLKKAYGRKTVIDDVSVSINKGDIYGFLGPNGAGKTTTIRMLLGLVRYDAGEIHINGFNLRKDFKKAIAKVGAVVETPRFFEDYSAYANLKMIRRLYQGISRERIDEVLEITGIISRKEDKVRTFSLGMKQRLGVARALLNSPELIILDEPTNGLDPQGMKEIREMILKLSREKGITFFISTHLLNEVELICNKVGIINHGRKLVEGYVKDLLSSEYEVLDLYTGSPQKALNLLHEIPYVIQKDMNEAGLQVKILKDTSPKLLRFLIENQIELKYVVPKNQSLEDYFIEQTKGGEHIV